MRMLDRRPAGAFASAFYIFACMLFCVGYGARFIALFILFAVFSLVLILSNRISFGRGVCALTAGMLAAALFSCAVADIKIVDEKNRALSERCVTGTVTEVQYKSSYSGIYTVKSENGRFILRCGNGELDVGDVIECDVEPSLLEDRYLEYSRADGVFVSAEAEDEVKLVEYDSSLTVSVAKLRQRLAAKLKSSMSEKSGGFAAAVLLGDKSELSDAVRRDFRVLGISHVLALSGTHLSVLFYAVTRLVPEKRRFLRLFTLCPAVLFYMLLTGFSSSVTRAGIMFIIGVIGASLNKKADSFTALSVSAMLMCLIDSYAPFDTGLQLSYASVIGLIVAGELRVRIAEGKSGVWRKIAGKVVPSFTVPLLVLPLLWLKFGEVSLISPISNLLLVPAAVLLIPICAVTLLSSAIPAAFVLLSSLSDVLISGYLGISGHFAEAVGSTLSLAGEVTAILILLYSAAVITAILSGGKLRQMSASLSVILVCASLFSAQRYISGMENGMTLCYAASKTDEALSVAFDGYNILIDMGVYPTAVSASADAGSVYGSDRIDAMFITSPHMSHKATITKISENYYLSSVWLPAAQSEGERKILQSLASEADFMGLQVYTYIPGETLHMGDCEFEVPLSGQNGQNRQSMTFTLRKNGKTVRYSNCDSTLICGADVHIVGVHGAENKGVLALDGFPEEGCVLISPRNAASFDSIPECAYVTNLGTFFIPPDGEGAPFKIPDR